MNILKEGRPPGWTKPASYHAKLEVNVLLGNVSGFYDAMIFHPMIIAAINAPKAPNKSNAVAARFSSGEGICGGIGGVGSGSGSVNGGASPTRERQTSVAFS